MQNILQVIIMYNYYMACSWSRYNAQFDWLIVGYYSPAKHMGPIMGLQKQSKKPYNKQLINLKRLVLTGKSQTSALPYWLRYSLVKVLVWDDYLKLLFGLRFSIKTPLSGNK